MLLKEWNAKLQKVKKSIKIQNQFDENISDILELHSSIFPKELGEGFSFESQIWEDLTEKQARIGINEKGRTVVYSLWHATRIEDITVNNLVCSDDEVFDAENYKKKIGSTIRDTGNALTLAEILEFSKEINFEELKNYRIQVGQKTEKVIKSLQFDDLKRKVRKRDLDKILEKGSVISHKDAIWLLEFWGNKDVAGIIFMPCLRHHVVHINEALKAKNSIKNNEV